MAYLKIGPIWVNVDNITRIVETKRSGGISIDPTQLQLYLTDRGLPVDVTGQDVEPLLKFLRGNEHHWKGDAKTSEKSLPPGKA